MVTKFFFYLFVYLLIKFDNKYNNFSNFEKKDILILSIVFSFLLGSYYYFFIISSLAFIIFLFYKNKFSLSFIVDNFKKIALLALLFIIFSIPTILNTLYVEPDYLERLGIFEIDLNKKKEILKYIFNKFTKIDFIALSLLTFSLNWIINLKKFSGYKLTNILNILLISSIMSPVIFFIISPITLHISSFFAMIINLIFLNIFIQGIIFFKSVINFIFLRFNTVKFLILIVIILTFNYNYFLNSYNSNVKNNEYNDYRNELFLFIKEIKSYQSTNPNAHILTFDRNLQIWSIMNDIKFIIPLSGQVVPKTHNHIEDDLIDTFKFFNLDVEDFVNFLSVKKMNFRYTNAELQNYFWGRYTANSLKTYNDSEDFDDEVLFNIKNTALIYHQNLAIPNFELKRLKKKFLNNQINHKFSPDIIVLNETFVDRAIIPENYCLKKDFKKFNYFLVKKSNDCD